MATLTVAEHYSVDGGAFKSALEGWLSWFIRAIQRSAVASSMPAGSGSLCWFVEFQRRGAPHVHVLYTHRIEWEPAMQKWVDGIIERGVCSEKDRLLLQKASTKFEKLRKVAAMSGYVAKYACKSDQKELPEGYEWIGRWWGVRGLRSSVGCQITASAAEPAAGALLRLGSELDKLAEQKILRKLRWQYGAGAVYFPRRNVPNAELILEEQFDRHAVRCLLVMEGFRSHG